MVAATFRDARKTCIEGPTRMLAAFADGEVAHFRRNELQIILVNGAKIYGYSADQPERLRGATCRTRGSTSCARGGIRRPGTRA